MEIEEIFEIEIHDNQFDKALEFTNPGDGKDISDYDVLKLESPTHL